jgi:hypothetical protein
LTFWDFESVGKLILRSQIVMLELLPEIADVRPDQGMCAGVEISLLRKIVRDLRFLEVVSKTCRKYCRVPDTSSIRGTRLIKFAKAMLFQYI